MDSQANLNLNYINPTVASDGWAVLITGNNQVTLSFWQRRQQEGNNLVGDVVASVRLHNLDELKMLEKQISDTLKQHEDREK